MDAVLGLDAVGFFPPGGRRTSNEHSLCVKVFFFIPLGADTMIKSQNIFPISNISMEPYPHF